MLFVLVLTLITFLLEMSASEYLEMKLKTDANYQNVIPLDTRYDIEAAYDVSLLTCSFRCLLNHPYCCAILYNEISRSCRALNSFLDDGSVMTSHGETWKFLTKEQVCPSGWFPFNGHCYFFVETKFNWNIAEKSCMKNGSYLIEIGSESENKWVVDFFVRSKLPEKCAGYMECAFWIGFTDQALEGKFSWKHNNENSKYTNWGTNEPNNGGDEDCAVFIAPSISYEWNDDRCPKLMMSVCEMDTNM